jgi:U4/U6.U5 tri-snRNP-associated protein 1
MVSTPSITRLSYHWWRGRRGLWQAFKQLSHYFHGKHSGKNKAEKKLRKLDEELLMAKASSTDTPLGTAQAMRERQVATGSAYVVLSQGNKTCVLCYP